MTEKSELRRRYRRLRDAIPDNARAEKSEALAERLFASNSYQTAETVLCYVSFGSEAGTWDILKRALKEGKRLAVPLCDPVKHEIRPCMIKALDQLKAGHYGIPEPDPAQVADGRIPVLDQQSMDLCLVPALCFDTDGYRLGYGGGYYDRFLNGFQGASIGLAFRECLCDALPRGLYDQKVNFVLAE